MPVYNAENFLNKSITSILSQTFRDFEFIILDDASTDGSLVIIKKYSKKDSRIRVLKNKKNKTPCITRDILLKEARTNFAAWMDADDISLPHRLQTQYQFLQDNPNIDVVSCQIWNAPLEDHLIKSFLLLQGSSIPNASAMFRLKKIKKYKISYNKNYFTEDYKFWVDAACYCNFHNLKDQLYFVSTHSISITGSYRQKQDESKLIILKEHCGKFKIKVSENFLAKLLVIKNEKITKDFLGEIQEKYLAPVFRIKKFYNYSKVHPYMITLVIHNFLYHNLSNKKRKISKEELKLVKVFLKEIFKRWQSLDQEKILKGFWLGVCKRLETKGIYFFLKNYGLKRFFIFSFQSLKLLLIKK